MNQDTLFRQWVTEYADLLYRFGLKRLGDEELAKDMVQETFLAAWRNRDGYKGEASVKNWLMVILRSKIIDHFRKMSTRPALELLRQEHNDNCFFDESEHWRKGMYPKPWTVDCTSQVELKEFYQQFRRCNKKLKEVQQAVFTLKYIDGLSSAEICATMQITPANYWVLLHRAKVQLRACLEKNWTP